MTARLSRILADAFAAAAPALLGIEAAPFAACWAAEQLRTSRAPSATTHLTSPPRRSMPMNILTSIKRIFSSPAVKPVVAATESGLAAAVKAAAQAGNPIGEAAIAAATAAEATTDTGVKKKADVVAAIVPIVIQEAAKGSVQAVVADVEYFAGLVVEEVVAAMKQTPLGMLATALLTAFGVKL